MGRVVIEGECLKAVLGKLEEARRSVDDLIDTFEMLQDEGFQAELKESLREAEAGEVVEFGCLEELRNQLSRDPRVRRYVGAQPQDLHETFCGFAGIFPGPP